MIHLLWCTIRPEMFMEAHRHWMNTCKGHDSVRTKIAVNTEEEKNKLEEYAKLNNCEVRVVGNEKIGLSYPAYCLTSELKGDSEDIVVFASDDFFSPENWDEYLLNKFKDFNGCLIVRDGFQDRENFSGIPSITIPIMSFQCLEKLNRIVFHPAYNHLFSDSELYINVMELGLLKDDRKNDMTTFEHRHYLLNKRKSDKYDDIYGNYWSRDAEVFRRRMHMPLEERLKV